MPDVQDAAFIAAIVVPLLVESWWSRANERQLRLLGAREPADDVYPWMQVIYPASFGLMIAEGLLAPSGGMPVWGALAFAAAKGLKYWAIASLGSRWCFRVLVPPGSARVVRGPYRWIGHPNYVAVALELLAVGVFFGAWRSGPPCWIAFAWLMWKRVRVEDPALDDGRAP